MAVQLTERDIRLLELLSATGTCTLAQAQQIYSTTWYHYRRIENLRREGYLLKKGSFLELAKKGADIVGETKYRVRNDEVRDLSVEVANLALSLDYPFISSRVLRKEFSLNRKTYFKGAITHKDKQYFIYFLGEKSTQSYITSIKGEMKALSAAEIMTRAVVFNTTPDTMTIFGVDSCRLEELLLLPYPAGVDMLNKYLPMVIEGQPTSRPFAHTETKENYIVSLILNDVVKRDMLEAYYYTARNDKKDKSVKIICLPQQKKFFAGQYPLAEITPINPR